MAVRHHEAGQLVEAETLYRQILAIDKDHIQSLHHLGLVAYRVGHIDNAADLIGRAILLNDRIPEFHYRRRNLREPCRAMVRNQFS
jgi:protein O-GlcNAc transferase